MSVMSTINRLRCVRRHREGLRSLHSSSEDGRTSLVFKSLATEGGVINLVTFSFVSPGGLRQD